VSTSNGHRDPNDSSRPTRRAILEGALAAAIVGGAATTARAQVKAKPTMVQYQQKPKGDQECDKCLHWVPPDACKMVEGKINPKGWCTLYVAKPK
jgi:hypothetical protein